MVLDATPAVIVTRFSFLGHSGWKIPAENREAILFDPARLNSRLRLFERITLASLRAQTDQRFHHYVLTSDRLPDWAMQRLHEITAAAYPADRFAISASPPGNARKYLRNFMAGGSFGENVVQIVLDDDDGLASDFMATVGDLLAGAAAENRLAADKLPFFLSFSRGIGLVFSDVGAKPQAYMHRYPYINLGLTMVGPAQGMNILAIDHLHTPKRAGCVPEGGRQMFVRSVHGFNDSRVALTERWKPLPD